jgi:hypothetical protein
MKAATSFRRAAQPRAPLAPAASLAASLAGASLAASLLVLGGGAAAVAAESTGAPPLTPASAAGGPAAASSSAYAAPAVPLARAARALLTHGDRGAVVAVLPEEHRAALAAARACPVVADAAMRPRPSLAFAQTSRGRWHCIDKSMDIVSLRAFERLEQLFAPCAAEFFAAEAQDGAFYRSELQVVSSQPGAAAQMWHQDNSSRGLTVVVPLLEQTPELGPTQLLLGSQRLTGPTPGPEEGLAHRIWACFASVEVAQPPLALGSALLMDARLVHRGLPNNSAAIDRPVVIYRYDLVSSPPPGHTVASTTAVRLLGLALHACALLKSCGRALRDAL